MIQNLRLKMREKEAQYASERTKMQENFQEILAVKESTISRLQTDLGYSSDELQLLKVCIEYNFNQIG